MANPASMGNRRGTWLCVSLLPRERGWWWLIAVFQSLKFRYIRMTSILRPHCSIGRTRSWKGDDGCSWWSHLPFRSPASAFYTWKKVPSNMNIPILIALFDCYYSSMRAICEAIHTPTHCDDSHICSVVTDDRTNPSRWWLHMMSHTILINNRFCFLLLPFPSSYLNDHKNMMILSQLWSHYSLDSQMTSK